VFLMIALLMVRFRVPLKLNERSAQRLNCSYTEGRHYVRVSLRR